ncbi:MAG: hypothetical protein ACFE0Q_11460 [Anaerolineae bacterium]
MGIQLNWYNEERTRLWMTFEGDWTIDEFQQAIITSSQMIEMQPHIVHTISDFRRSSMPSTAALVNIPVAIRHIKPNQGIAIVLTHNETVQCLAQTATAMYPALRRRVYVVNSPELAERMLAHFEKQVSISAS